MDVGIIPWTLLIFYLGTSLAQIFTWSVCDTLWYVQVSYVSGRILERRMGKGCQSRCPVSAAFERVERFDPRWNRPINARECNDSSCTGIGHDCLRRCRTVYSFSQRGKIHLIGAWRVNLSFLHQENNWNPIRRPPESYRCLISRAPCLLQRGSDAGRKDIHIRNKQLIFCMSCASITSRAAGVTERIRRNEGDFVRPSSSGVESVRSGR